MSFACEVFADNFFRDGVGKLPKFVPDQILVILNCWALKFE